MPATLHKYPDHQLGAYVQVANDDITFTTVDNKNLIYDISSATAISCVAPGSIIYIDGEGRLSTDADAAISTGGHLASVDPVNVYVPGRASRSATIGSLQVYSAGIGTGTTIANTGNISITVSGPSDNLYIYSDGSEFNKVTIKETPEQKRKRVMGALKGQIKTNLRIHVKQRHKFLESKVPAQELKARDSLRDILTEREWRRYVTNSFVIVKGISGKSYQLFKDQRSIKVYEHNKHTHSICIHTVRDCPPTDHVLNLKVLIEMDEDFIWQNGNVYYMNNGIGIFDNSNISLTLDPYRFEGDLVKLMAQQKQARQCELIYTGSSVSSASAS